MLSFLDYIKKRKYSSFQLLCLYIWIIVLLYLFDYIKFSPLYLTFFAFIFTVYHNTNTIFKKSLFERLFFIYFEFFILLIVIRKHFFINKKKLIIINDIFISLIIFFVYLLFLKLFFNKSFYDVYIMQFMK